MEKEQPDWMWPGVHNMHTVTREPTDKILYIGNARKRTQRVRPQAGRVYMPNGISPTLAARSGGCLEPRVLINYGTIKF